MIDYSKFKQLMGQAVRRTVTKSPEERAAHRKQRLAKYAHKNATYPYDNYRQRDRYGRNRMDEQQRNSHKPGTLQPRHIFPG